MTDKYLDKYRIPSARLPSWDYGSNGEYFITICTAKRNHYFGEIINEIMHLSEPGKKAYQYWMEIPDHFPFVSLDEFVVMPNHTHGIIIIDKPWGYWFDEALTTRPDDRRDKARLVSTQFGTTETIENNWDGSNNAADITPGVVETRHALSLRANHANRNNWIN